MIFFFSGYTPTYLRVPACTLFLFGYTRFKKIIEVSIRREPACTLTLFVGTTVS